TYDINGNMLSDGAWTHEWDWKDRLISSVLAPEEAQEVAYEYDEAKQRILKNNVTDEEVTLYIDKYFDREGATEKVYIYAGNTKIATVETTDEEETLVFHHEDHLTGGNVDTDSEGEVLQLLDYFPYGDTRIDESAEDYHNDYQFTGKERDEETGLSYYEARYYNSGIGRFIARDPWEGDIKDPQSLNKYSYVQNNPLKYTDPSGEARAINRPVEQGDTVIGAHAFVEITGNPYVNSGKRTTLGGYTTNFVWGDLFKGENYHTDYDLSESDYLATHEISPIAPYSKIGWEEKIYKSFQNLDTELGAYSPLGGDVISTGQGNSGNVFTQMLFDAGLPLGEIKTYTAPVPSPFNKMEPNFYSYNAGVGRLLPTKKTESLSSKIERMRSLLTQTGQSGQTSGSSDSEEEDDDKN
ncbi:RHS repeat-associated core domain-containing protein, partial [Candidatus Gracilibacteria bacterium]|nr:RHS repeat-associated core domain-containing protein [Candidatus Gracilibacteria bacterium]